MTRQGSFLSRLSGLRRRYPGKLLGLLRIPMDLAMFWAGVQTMTFAPLFIGHDLHVREWVISVEGLAAVMRAGNPWVACVGLVGLLSSLVLIAYADPVKHPGKQDPQDHQGLFNPLKFWRYPWEFASLMAIGKALNLLMSGISRARLDDLFLALCLIVGQVLVQIPERSPVPGAVRPQGLFAKLREKIAENPNRACAHVMNIGNLVFTICALAMLEFPRIFAGLWNICLNAYLMARASKRLTPVSRNQN